MVSLKEIWPDRKVAMVFPPVNKFSLEKHLNIDRKERIIISIGRFTTQKRHDFQLQIFSELIEENRIPRDTRILMIGPSDPEVSKLISLAKSLLRDKNASLKVINHKNASLGEKSDTILSGDGGPSIEFHFDVSDTNLAALQKKAKVFTIIL